MKFLTFYHPIPEFNVSTQNQLLNLILNSWNEKGFESIVCNDNDALSHPLYEQLLKSINDVSLKITKRPLPKFHETSITRWLAWATKLQNKETSIVGDYDVFNNNFCVSDSKSLLESDLTFLNESCLCLGSGTKKGFETWVEIIIEYTDKITNELEKITNNGLRGFHDQDLMEIISKKIDLKTNFNFKFFKIDTVVKNYDECMSATSTKTEFVHFSHSSVKNLLKKKYGTEWKNFWDVAEQQRLSNVIKFCNLHES